MNKKKEISDIINETKINNFKLDLSPKTDSSLERDLIIYVKDLDNSEFYSSLKKSKSINKDDFFESNSFKIILYIAGALSMLGFMIGRSCSYEKTQNALENNIYHLANYTSLQKNNFGNLSKKLISV